MKKVVVRCVGCGTVYDQNAVKDCPVCHFTVCDKVLLTVPTVENKVVIDFNAAMYNFPKVFGVQITSNN